MIHKGFECHVDPLLPREETILVGDIETKEII